MFKSTIQDGTKIDVQGRKHTYHYATDGSVPNPLESTYAALVGCAGVYALKACKKLNKSANGIEIEGKLIVRPENPSQPQKWITIVKFPVEWNSDEKISVIKEIQSCAVKELILQGSSLEFIEEII